MNCRQCGRELLEDTKFCGKCGFPVAKPDRAKIEIPQEEDPGVPADNDLGAGNNMPMEAESKALIPIINYQAELENVKRDPVVILRRLAVPAAIGIVVLLAAFIGMFMFFQNITTSARKDDVDRSKFPVVYLKDGGLFIKGMNTDKKRISDNIPMNKMGYSDVGRELVQRSSDGQTLYFIEDYEKDTGKGNLYYAEENKDKIKIASDVSYKGLKVYDNGNAVLFLQDYNEGKDKGDLCLFEKGKAKQKIGTDVNAEGFIFGNNQRAVLFISDYDKDKKSGNLYVKKPGKDKERIDTEVWKPIQYDAKTDTAIYSKGLDGFSEFNGTYGLYIKEKNRERERIASDVTSTPYFKKNSNDFLFQANYDVKKNLGDFYIKKGGKEKDKIDSDVSWVSWADPYTHNCVYIKDFDGQKGDIYLKIDGKDKEKITAGMQLPHPFFVNILVKTSEDYQNIAYTEDYNSQTMQGTIFNRTFKGGKLQEKLKIAEDSLLVKVSGDGKYILYLKDYNYEKSAGDLYVFNTNGKSQKLASDVMYSQMAVSEDGKYISFIADYSREKASGDLYVQEIGKEKNMIASDVHDVLTYDGKKIIFIKDYNDIKECGELYMKTEGKDAYKIDSDVNTVLFY